MCVCVFALSFFAEGAEERDVRVSKTKLLLLQFFHIYMYKLYSTFSRKWCRVRIALFKYLINSLRGNGP